MLLEQDQFNLFLYGWIAYAIINFPISFKVKAAYGRHISETWGPMMDNRTGWVLMEVPSLFGFLYFFLSGSNNTTIVTWIFCIIWSIHYINRSFIFPFRLNTKGKKMPIVLIAFGVIFNLVNGYINGYYFGTLGPVYESSWLATPQFILGSLLLVIGFYINQRSDHILINLRKPGETGYKIPEGGLFKYISCPNHFGECLEWGGFALMTWCLPSLAFFIWSFSNLIPRAIQHHQWYFEHFPDYPKERKAVLPFVL